MNYLFLVSGPQGSGKSTQAELLANGLHAPIFESGAELRAMVEQNLPGSEEVADYMKRGELVPHHFVDELFGQFFAKNSNAAALVSDGYPRNLPELSITEHLCAANERTIIGVNVDLDEPTSIERITARAEAAAKTGEHRPDDSVVAVKERLRLYREETVPVLDQVRDKHHLIVIDGHPSIEVVAAKVRERVDAFIGG